jgi:vacuolar-type H+-ATPase subunit E/Vma4
VIAPRETDLESRALETLARIVIEDARAEAGRAEDRAVNAARTLVRDAEDRIADLDRAARDLGRTRGVAADAAEAQSAVREIEVLQAGALDALFERYETRVRLALEALPKNESRYGAALRHWAALAAPAMDAPAEVFTAKRDRPSVYAALLETSAEDFHVRVDHRVHVGFVLRDLDGRTLFDARPAALVAAQRPALRALLEEVVPEAPVLEVPASLSAAAAAPPSLEELSEAGRTRLESTRPDHAAAPAQGAATRTEAGPSEEGGAG